MDRYSLVFLLTFFKSTELEDLFEWVEKKHPKAYPIDIIEAVDSQYVSHIRVQTPTVYSVGSLVIHKKDPKRFLVRRVAVESSNESSNNNNNNEERWVIPQFAMQRPQAFVTAAIGMNEWLVLISSSSSNVLQR